MSRRATRDHLRLAHGAQALSKAQVDRWYARFEAGPQAALSDIRWSKGPRKLTPARLQQIQGVVNREKRSTLRQITRDVGLATQTVHKALRKDLKLQKRPAKWVPYLLTAAQKLRCVNCAKNALAMMRRRNQPCHVISGDESWFWKWDPESKCASSQWVSAGEAWPMIIRKE